MLCVRLVFCLYAEDAGIFGNHGKFHNYLQEFSAREMRHALIDLFKVLDTKVEDRDPYIDDILAEFPYVNGGLFSDEDIEMAYNYINYLDTCAVSMFKHSIIEYNVDLAC